MSVQALTWVLEHSVSEHSARLVAISLANHAGADGDGSYPSIPLIARETRLGESTVRDGLDSLLELGEILEGEVSHLSTRTFMLPMHVPNERAVELVQGLLDEHPEALELEARERVRRIAKKLRIGAKSVEACLAHLQAIADAVAAATPPTESGPPQDPDPSKNCAPPLQNLGHPPAESAGEPSIQPPFQPNPPKPPQGGAGEQGSGELESVRVRLAVELRRLVSQATFETWLSELIVVEVSDERVLLHVPAAGFEWIRDRFGAVIAKAGEQVAPVPFVLEPDGEIPPSTPGPNARRPNGRRNRRYPR